MKVLSLFDGISACHLALTRAGIDVDTYYTAEIDRYATQISAHHYPDAIRFGDVTKWQEWDVDWSSIDLVTGGFPCQAWSVAGKQQGDKDERGMLFWTMLDIMKMVLKHNHKAYFLMENVKMKREFEEYITHHTEQSLGQVEKHLINSALVSAQNRNRYYWTNIQGIEQPKDKGLILADVIESGIATNEMTSKHSKANCLTSSYAGAQVKNSIEKRQRSMVAERPCEPREFKEDSLCHHAATATDLNGNDSIKRVYAETGKAPTITTMGGGHREPKVLVGRMVGRKINPDTGKRDDYNPVLKTEQRIETRLDEKCGTLTTVQKDNLVIEQTSYRKLTPLECERLQTFPDNWTLITNANGKQLVSNTQRYKSLGNAWTVDVIAHIFKGINNAK